jgi:AraC-like DNA-binding protein
MAALDIPKELVDLTLAYSGEEGLHPTSIPLLQISKSYSPTVPVHTVYRPSMCFIVQGAKETSVGEKKYFYEPTQYLITSIEVPAIGQVTQASNKKPYLCVVLEIDPGMVYEVLSKTGSLGETVSNNKSIYVADATTDLTDAVLRLMRTLKNPADQNILTPMIFKEIIYRLLSSKYAERIRQLGVAGSQMQRISKVIDIIKKDFAQSLKMEELAKVANMSVSTFHHHFKQATTMSPLQYQKQVRLQEARRLLSAEVSDAATAAFQVGYESPSQFSREYARLFGLPPMSDIKRLRGSATPVGA